MAHLMVREPFATKRKRVVIGLAASRGVMTVSIALIGACDFATGPKNRGLHERWYQPQTGWAWASPAVSGNVVYFATGAGEVIARDVSSGNQRWIAHVSQQSVDGANLLVRSGVVVAPSVFETVGLDAETSRGLWRYEAPLDTVDVGTGFSGPGSVMASHIDADAEAVYIPAWGASISAVELRTGAVRWVWKPGVMAGDTATSGIFRSGAMGVKVSGDTVFGTVWHATIRSMVHSEAWVVALDKRTGEEFWRVRLPFIGAGVLIQTAPALYKNLVIARTLFGQTFAIDRTTQKIAWEFVAPASRLLSGESGPLVKDDIVYVDGGDEAIYALNASNGSAIRRIPIITETTTDMLATDRHLIYNNGAELHILDIATGNEVLSTTQPHTYDPLFSSAPTASNGLVFINVADAAFCFDEP